MINQMQSIVSRNVDPLEAAVVSICMFQAGTTDNVIPQTAVLRGTVRSLDAGGTRIARKRVARSGGGDGGAARRQSEAHLPARLSGHAQSRGAGGVRGVGVAKEIAGEERVDTNVAPVMGAEDFSFMLNARPGAFIFVGNGESAGLHHPAYDFNDEMIPLGSSYWVRLVEKALPA